jgi:YetF C-terminal domain
MSTAMISFLKRSQKKRVSSATSREGGGAVGIRLECCAGSNWASGRLMPRDGFSRKRYRRRHMLDQAPYSDTIFPMNALWNSFETLLGLSVEPKDLTFVQISLRGIIVFLATLAMVRLGHKRSLSHKTPFDAVLLVILASVLSRAINGSAAFFATIGGGLVLVLLHRAFAHLAYYSHGFGILVKGKPDTIVRDGQCDFQMMRRNHISTHDLEEDMRLDAHIDDLSRVRLARVERSGDISFIKK